MITIHWINSPSSRWKTFVANRVSTIQSLSDPKKWLHVRSESNPADLVSRGLTPDEIVFADVWWNGPKFLQNSDETWNQPAMPPSDEDLPERRKAAAALTANQSSDGDVFERIKFRDRFTSFRVRPSRPLPLAEMLLLVPRLSTLEWKSSLAAIIRVTQRESFPIEFKGLQKKNFNIRDSSLKSLSLFLDEDCIIRVGGRLKLSNLPYSAKHPILLLKDHYVTLMIFNFLHRQIIHVGPQGLLAVMRQNYWPISGRNMAKTICQGCVQCTRTNPRPLKQKMGDLPTERVTMSPPFYQVGVDYCGPFFVHYHVRGKQPTKTYLAVFVCVTTKATHLGLVSDLSTAAFLGAMKRFVATQFL